MGKLEECKQVGEEVCSQANKWNSLNYNVIAGHMKSILSGAYKQEKNFPKAEEMLETSTEVMAYFSLLITQKAINIKPPPPPPPPIKSLRLKSFKRKGKSQNSRELINSHNTGLK